MIFFSYVMCYLIVLLIFIVRLYKQTLLYIIYFLHTLLSRRDKNKFTKLIREQTLILQEPMLEN